MKDARTNEAIKQDTYKYHSIFLPGFGGQYGASLGHKDPTAGMEPVVMSRKWAEEDSQPKLGEGWLGKGAPIKMHQGHRIRDIEDGAGLCSPGRWNRHKRRLPETEGLAKQVVDEMGMDEEKWGAAVIRMMAGKQAESPFAEKEVEKGRAFLTKWLESKGQPCTINKDDVVQAPRLRLLQAFLRYCGDPDAEAMEAFCEGVRLGYRARMPRTPAVFNSKEKWRLKYEGPEVPVETWSPNYQTARERAAFIEEKVKEDVAAGRMIKTTYKEAKKEYGERLLIGALWVVEEGSEKFRLIHDGSHRTLVNHMIRARDHVPGPLVGDIAAMMKDAEDDNERSLGLVWDFTAAHRVVAVHKSDWGLQACTLADLRGKIPEDNEELYLNTVGTFGFSTAGHWWGRLAAALIRAGHYFLHHALSCRIMLFADDGLALLPLAHFRPSLKALFALYLIFGFEIKWKKVRGGTEFQWVGYWLQMDSYKSAFPPSDETGQSRGLSGS